MAKKNIAFVDVDWLEAGMKSLGDSIRAKSGAEDGLAFPDEMKAAVDSITGGIGEEEINDILDEINGEIVGETQYTVTFVGVNGEQLGQMSVYEGDDCADPVATGVFETPTKEGDKYYGWSFSGWSFTDSGEADEAALSNVYSDRTLYAAFSKYEIYIAQGECGRSGAPVYWGLNPDFVLKVWGNGNMGNYYLSAVDGDYTPWNNYQAQITAVVISEGVTGVGQYNFAGCTALTSVSLPTGFFSINHNAFEGCTALTTITIPATTRFIHAKSFWGCTALNIVIFEEPSGWTTDREKDDKHNFVFPISESDLADPNTAATLLASTYALDSWANYSVRGW